MRILAAALALAGLLSGPAMAQEGVPTEDWFAVTFKDVAEDMEAAAAEGKRLAIIFEQEGCIYCIKLHEEVLSDPEVRDYITANFVMVQMNLWGAEEVTDVDGGVMTEKQIARRWGIVFTPTIMFLPEQVPASGTAGEAAVASMPGAFGKWTVLHLFQWVAERGYDGEEHFQRYHARKLDELRAAGRI